MIPLLLGALRTGFHGLAYRHNPSRAGLRFSIGAGKPRLQVGSDEMMSLHADSSGVFGRAACVHSRPNPARRENALTVENPLRWIGPKKPSASESRKRLNPR